MRLCRTRSRQAEKDDDRSIQPDDVFIRQSTQPGTNFRLRNRRDLVDHQLTRRPKSVAGGRLDCEPEQRRIDDVRCQRAKRHGRRRVEGVVLKDDGGPGFPRVVRTTGNRPDLAALHSSDQSAIASTNSCSSRSNRLSATNRACWRAWRRKLRERTSGTQIWIGRKPRLRSRARWARTLSRDGDGFVVGIC